MLLEKSHTIPFSRVRPFEFDVSLINPHLADNLGGNLLEAENDYFSHTGSSLMLLLELFNSKEGSARILGIPHKARPRNDDLLEFWSPFANQTLGLYCVSSGGVFFALRDERSKAKSHSDEKPKVQSTGSKLGDAELVAISLKFFAKQAHSQVQIDGPTDVEPLVVITLPQIPSIARYGKSGDVIGIVFRPVVQGNNRAVHGNMQLLVRERQQ